jgi:hypothetical protein
LFLSFFLVVVVCLQVQQHELWLNDVIGCTTARFHQVVSEVETRLCVRLETEPVRITGRECRSLAFTLFHSRHLNSLHLNSLQSRQIPSESQIGKGHSHSVTLCHTPLHSLHLNCSFLSTPLTLTGGATTHHLPLNTEHSPRPFRALSARRVIVFFIVILRRVFRSSRLQRCVSCTS